MKAAKEYIEGRQAATNFEAGMKALFQAKKSASAMKPKAGRKPKKKA